MQTPDLLHVIPNFSNYSIDSDGNVWRTTPSRNGHYARRTHKIAPSIHPRGHQWTVLLTGDDGVRRRASIESLQKLIFGQ